MLKGSYIYPQVAAYAASGIKMARENHATSIDKNGILQEDICFGSPSYASTFVCGKNSNGLIEWKDKNGVLLKNLDSGEAETPAETPAEILHLAGKKVAATGKISGAGFIIMEGSRFSSEETESCPTWIKSLRIQMVAEGKVKDCIFTKDVYFKSTSAAAACVTGGSANGNIMWLYPDGQSIKERHNK